MLPNDFLKKAIRAQALKLVATYFLETTYALFFCLAITLTRRTARSYSLTAHRPPLISAIFFVRRLTFGETDRSIISRPFHTLETFPSARDSITICYKSHHRLWRRWPCARMACGLATNRRK